MSRLYENAQRNPPPFSSLLWTRAVTVFLGIFLISPSVQAALNIPITVNLSEPVTVTGTPRIAVDVGGITRYATYTSGTGSNTLTFILSPQIGDVDLDGVTVSSPIDLNGGHIKDNKGNDSALTFTPPSTSNVKINYPSLGLDFTYDADGRYTLNNTVYNDISSFLTASGGTFTRSSTATYYDNSGVLQTAASDSPRFDYDSVSHAPKGLLIEESRTNYARYSEEVDNAIWSKRISGTSMPTVVTANFTTAPNGTLTADRVQLNRGGGTGSSDYSLVYTTYTFGSSTTCTKSIWVKSNTGSNQTIVIYDADGAIGSTYTVTSSWQRLILGPNIANNSVSMVIGTRGGSAYYSGGDQVLDISLWGAQMEQGPFATSYIPTTSAPTTRSADILTIPTSGWFALTQGSFFVQSEIFGGSSNGRFVTGIGTDANNYIGFPYVVSNTISSLYYRASGSGPVADGSPTLSFNTTFKSGAAYSTTAHTLSYAKNGTISATGGSVNSMASASTLYIGTSPYTPANITSGYYQKLKYYPARVTDTQLQLLTQ